MPAPIPPGYTRGQIMFIGHLNDADTARHLLQSFWTEAGAFGARILVVDVAGDEHGQLAENLFRDWEANEVTKLEITDRRAALDKTHVQTVESATAILLCAQHGLETTRRIGGTPLAQAIRRANARNKIVGGVGQAASALCQHMLLAGDAEAQHRTWPHSLRAGLGADQPHGRDIGAAALLARTRPTTQLLAAVQCNPFLIGVGLAVDTAVIVYQDATLDVRGSGRVTILDGADAVDDNDIGAPTSPLVHSLAEGYGYNLDAHTVRFPTQTDIPSAENHVTSAF